eukprot:SAG25_NODE_136_length_14215_cov_15.693114_13_plen_62_part_00
MSGMSGGRGVGRQQAASKLCMHTAIYGSLGLTIKGVDPATHATHLAREPYRPTGLIAHKAG